MKPSVMSLLCCCGLAVVGLACLLAGMNPEWMPGKKPAAGGGMIEGFGPPPPDPKEDEKDEEKKEREEKPERPKRSASGSP